VIDIVNIGIETLVRHCYELPAFDTLVREARAQRAATTQAMYARIDAALGESGRAFLDALYVVPRHVSAWNDIKQDAARPTIDGMRALMARYDQLTGLACHAGLLAFLAAHHLATGLVATHHHWAAHAAHRLHVFLHALHVLLHQLLALFRVACRLDFFHLLLHFLHAVLHLRHLFVHVRAYRRLGGCGFFLR
jgi:hypothetical protein